MSDTESRTGSTYDKRELENKKVTKLRKIVREEVSSGTWISHAHKDELIRAILTGKPPASATPGDTDTAVVYADESKLFGTNFLDLDESHPSEGLGDELEAMSGALKNLFQRVVQHELAPLARRIRKIEEELGIERKNEDLADTIIDVMSQKSADAHEENGAANGENDAANGSAEEGEGSDEKRAEVMGI